MTTDTHPRQLRFPGQAAAPAGPVDMMMMYLVHHAFRRDLADFAAAARVTPVEDRDTWRALAQRWVPLVRTLHHHHECEDRWLWPALAERATDEERAVLDAMESEHAEIDPGLEACDAGFARLAEHADADARAALAVRLTAVGERLGAHLAHEETETMALLQRVFTPADWKEIDARFSEGLSLRWFMTLVPWALTGVPAELREEVFSRAGGPFRVLWLLSRGRFGRLHRRAFRHLSE